MARYSIDEFVRSTGQRDRGEGFVVVQPFEEVHLQRQSGSS